MVVCNTTEVKLSLQQGQFLLGRNGVKVQVQEPEAAYSVPAGTWVRLWFSTVSMDSTSLPLTLLSMDIQQITWGSIISSFGIGERSGLLDGTVGLF